MRAQRVTPRTVQLVRVTVEEDNHGDAVDGGAPQEPVTVEGAQFYPERVVEQTGSRQAPVVEPAYWNLPGVHELDSDDQIMDGDVTWYVIGGSAVWLDRTKVPVTRTRSV